MASGSWGWQTALIDRRLDLHEQLGHLRRPTLLIAFLDELQFPQVMSMTQTVGDIGIGEVRLPVVVYGPPGQCGQNPDGIHGCCAALRMHGVRGQPLRTGRVEPLERASHAQATLIKMDHGRRRRVTGTSPCALAGFTAAAISWVAVTTVPSPTACP